MMTTSTPTDRTRDTRRLSESERLQLRYLQSLVDFIERWAEPLKPAHKGRDYDDWWLNWGRYVPPRPEADETDAERLKRLTEWSRTPGVLTEVPMSLRPKPRGRICKIDPRFEPEFD
jgi:hypothetical protein